MTVDPSTSRSARTMSASSSQRQLRKIDANTKASPIAWGDERPFNKDLTRGSTTTMQYVTGGSIWGDDPNYADRVPQAQHKSKNGDVRRGLYLHRDSDIKCTQEAIKRARNKIVLRSPAELQALRVQTELMKARPFRLVKKRTKQTDAKPAINYKPPKIDLSMKYMLGGDMEMPAEPQEEDEMEVEMQDGTCSTPATARSNQTSRAVQILQRKRNQLRCATAPTQRSPSRPIQSWSRVDQVASRAEDALGSLSRQRRNRSQLSTARSGLSRSSSNASTSRLQTPATPAFPRRKKVSLSLAKYLLS